MRAMVLVLAGVLLFGTSASVEARKVLVWTTIQGDTFTYRRPKEDDIHAVKTLNCSPRLSQLSDEWDELDRDIKANGFNPMKHLRLYEKTDAAESRLPEECGKP